MRYSFRSATKNDYDEILNLKIQVHKFHVINRPDFFSNSELIFKKESFYKMLEDANWGIFVIEDDNHIYGYAIIKILKIENNPIINHQLRIFIDDLCIDEAHRKKGIGSILMKELESICKAKGYRYLELNVWDFNTNAIDFYKKHGMKTIVHRMEKIIDE